MIKLNLAAIASGASIDNATGNLTLFNIIEEIRIPKDRLPISIPELALVGSFTRLDAQIETMGFQLDYILPDGKTMAVNKSSTPFQGDRVRIVMRLNGMPIDTLGRHKLRLSWTWKSKGEEDEGSFDIFLDVLHFEMPPQNQQQH